MIRMNVEIRSYPSRRTVIAAICGDIDHHTARYFRGEIDKAIRQHLPRTLILDFSGVTFMDSSGIGLVMGRYKIINEMDGEVLVASPPTYIRKVLQLAGIHRLTKIITDIKPFISEVKTDSDNAAEQNENDEEIKKEEEKIKESDEIEAETYK
ncbi:anti-sigma factor antagonist [Ruminococcus sp.]|uniref:STAS domain-containing protein n=1 Tax=Ruminococcus sp. TaxID=41978 RepID=UPI0025EDDB79|nr:anti-sigma factor antagonist [Ruminococcus sp.]